MNYTLNVKRLCLKCLSVQNMVIRPDYFLPLGGFFIGLGFYYMPFGLFERFSTDPKTIFFLLFSIAEIILGTYMVVGFIKTKYKFCNVCNHSTTIELDSDEANDLKKQHNLNL